MIFFQYIESIIIIIVFKKILYLFHFIFISHLFSQVFYKVDSIKLFFYFIILLF